MKAAEDRDEAELNQHLASSYGIFSGPPKAMATIRFSPHAARWVADEHWHSQQQGEWLKDGRYELHVPYSNSRELLMDVLKYGPDAEIVCADITARGNEDHVAVGDWGVSVNHHERRVGREAYPTVLIGLQEKLDIFLKAQFTQLVPGVQFGSFAESHLPRPPIPLGSVEFPPYCQSLSS